MWNWTASPMTAQGQREGEPSLPSMRNRLRPQPARLVRGSSRRIMTMRFRPANIRVINRRASSSAVIGSAVRTTAQRPTSRNVFPLRRPSKASVDAGTAHRWQGFASPRQTPPRPCHLCAVPAETNVRRAAPAGTLHPQHSMLKRKRLAPSLTEESQPEFTCLSVSTG